MSPWYFALVQAALDNRDEFFRLAGKAVVDRSIEIASLVTPDRVFDSVRSDPRYGELLKKVGLPLALPAKEVSLAP